MAFVSLSRFDDGAADGGLSYGALLIALSPTVSRDAALAALAEARFTGWISPELGPQEIAPPSLFAVGLAATVAEAEKDPSVAAGGGVDWLVAVAETPLGHVAGDRTTLRELAQALAAELDTAVVAVTVRTDTLLTIAAYAGAEKWVDYASDAHVLRPDDEFAFGPEGAHGAGALARLSGHPEAEKGVYAALSESASEDAGESERLMILARVLGWPQWLVSVSGLPKRLLRGPDPEEFTRLRAGATGLGSRAKAKLSKVKRRSILPAGE